VGSNLREVSGYVLCGVSIVSGPGLWVLAHKARIRAALTFTSPSRRLLTLSRGVLALLFVRRSENSCS
jgi:hypothetical protein